MTLLTTGEKTPPSPRRRAPQNVHLGLLLLVAIVAGCDGGAGRPDPDAGPPGEPAGGGEASLAATEAPRPDPGLPSFDDYPVSELFAGSPAAVDLASHPEAGEFRTALTRDAEAGAQQARFAGHYRIVTIGCGASCRTLWAVDLRNGEVRKLFTSSFGAAFRPDSRLIIENPPAHYESLLEEMSPAEVEVMMDRYGPPRFWLESDGELQQIGPHELRVDARAAKLVPSAATWRCRNDLEVRCGEAGCEASGDGDFTPMSVHLDESGSISVCAYTGCWEGAGVATGDDRFLVLTGRELEFTTAPAAEPAPADLAIVLDRTDGVATLKVNEFAQPLICQRLESAP